MTAARRVEQAFLNWGHLDHAPFRILAWMALHATEEPARLPVFDLGSESLVSAIGRNDSQDEKDRRAVRRSLSTLERCGALSRQDHPCPGRRASYALHLDPPAKVAVS